MTPGAVRSQHMAGPPAGAALSLGRGWVRLDVVRS